MHFPLPVIAPSNRKQAHTSTPFWLLLAVPIFLSACKKLIHIDPPVNEVASTLVFADDHTALSAMTGLYSQMMAFNTSFANSALTLYPGLSADELVRTQPDPSEDAFIQNNLSASNPALRNNLWQRAYNYIYHANAVLEGLDRSTTLSPSLKQQVQGEALTIRAFCYFYLSQIFGDVPLAQVTDYHITSGLARSPQGEVQDSVTADLSKAVSLLPAITPSPVFRPSHWAAVSLLARAYLYRGAWEQAELLASQVINSGVFQLATDLNQVFLAGSPEAIWQLVPVSPGINTFEGVTFVPYFETSLPVYTLSPFLLQAFEVGDQRKEAWVKTALIEGQAYPYPYKYKISFKTEVTENYTVLRLAEQYLIRAEARAHLGKDAAARADLNVLRQRAGLANLKDTIPLWQAIEQERRTELFAEWGHRWFDLKRTGRSNAVLGAEKADWQQTDTLYPVPLPEIQANPALTQNPGY